MVFFFNFLNYFYFTDETRRREPSANRRSSSATPEGKTRLPGSTKPAQKAAEDKQQRSRKSSVSKLPSSQHKPTQPETNKKISTESTGHSRGHRSLPSTPRERKSSATQQNGLPQKTIKDIPKSAAAESKTKGSKTQRSSRQENRFVNQKKELGSTKANGRTKKDLKTNPKDKKENGLSGKETEDTKGNDSVSIALEDSSDVFANGQPTDPSNHSSDNLDEMDDNSHHGDIFSADESCSFKTALNGRRKTSECSLETDSDITSDLLSDFTDTDFDFRSQRYSGLSETSSDFSFGTSPAWKLFHSVEHDRNCALKSTGELDVLELGTSPTLKDCLLNLNLEGSVTPTMKKRIFEKVPRSDQKEDSPDSTEDTTSHPTDKAIFFDVEKYNDKSADEEEVVVGSPRKWSLVQSLISSIEKRSGSSGDGPRAHTNTAVVTRSDAVSAGSHSVNESAVAHKTASNQEMPSARLPSFDELNKVFTFFMQFILAC